MRNFVNPRWLLVINTLPLVVLFYLSYGQFSTIKTLLDESNIELWKTFGISLGALGLLNLGYVIYLMLYKKSVSLWFGILALLSYIPYIYLYGYHLDKIIPFSIPEWMVSDNIFLYVGTFLMPTIAYSIFILVSHFTPEHKEHRAWINFLIAVSIPMISYLFLQVILPLWQPVEGEFFFHTLVVLIITATILFLFFLLRAVLILLTKKTKVWTKYQLAWKILIAIVLPSLGLLVNNGYLFDFLGGGDSGIFGDFNDYWFYILAIINGVLVCLPNLKNKGYRLAVFIGRSITYAYTFYFFLVFLPFLPLSVVGIIAIGVGFLMLSPLLLFLIHSNDLSKDVTYLKMHFSKARIIGIMVLSFLTIPLLITARYLKDKSVLNETLTYLYSPDYSKSYNIDKVSLQKTLEVVTSHKDRRGSSLGIFGSNIPYMSSYFNWLVLDNLTLSDVKINKIERIFFDKTSFKLRPENIQNHHVEITNIATTSTYDKTQNAWRSWLNLEITNKSGNIWFSEYSTTIDLPKGCWISDYYLYVGNKKEPGILAEKKSAMWIFSQIRSENRDPGILYYLTENRIAFRVFPFAKGEVRKTGIEFLHKEPIQLKIDDHHIELGNPDETIYENIETEHVVYITGKNKAKLNSVKREPYFHFLIDTSKDQGKNSPDFIHRIQQLTKTNASLSKNAKVSFVNSYTHTTTFKNGWKEQYKSQPFEGGFFLDRAIRTTLVNTYKEKATTYPIIVVVTDGIENAVMDNDFSDLKFTFPESNVFYHLNKEGILKEHSLTEHPLKELPEAKRACKFCETVLEYQLSDGSTTYIPDNNTSSILLKKDIFSVSKSEIKEKNWQTALQINGLRTSQILHPEISEKNWINLVQYSFISKIMNPTTSYLVVENEAQKAMLKKKQEQVLSGNTSLDLGEDVLRMTEPNVIPFILLFGLLLWLRAQRKRKLIS